MNPDQDSSTTPFLAGAGRATIALPSSLFPLEGFTTVHDDLEVRVVAFRAEGELTVIAVVDQTSLAADALERIRRILHEVTRADDEHVVVTVSHTFSAPHIGVRGTRPGAAEAANDTLVEAVETAVRDAATRASKSMRAATLASATGLADVNVNRDVETREGWWLGADDRGHSPSTVPVVVARGLDGRVIAVLFSAAVQPSVMNGSLDRDGGRAVTADLAGSAARHIEGVFPGSVAAFLIGAAGDQSPRFTAVRSVVAPDGAWSEFDAGADGFLLVDLLGERLGAEVARQVERAAPAEHTPVVVVRDEVVVTGQAPPAREDLRPTRAHAFDETGPVAVPLLLVLLGDVVFVGVAPELTRITASKIEAASPFPMTVVLTMVDGAAKYLADADSFERITYEAMSSRFARGSADLLEERVAVLLRRLHALASVGPA